MVRTCRDYAEMLQPNKAGDRQKVISLQDESLAVPAGLCMRPLMEQVLSRRDILRA